ncbi:A/G-specific adenine glycosylase [Marinomonas ostreistagni]|uniref:A/G-specific adenine glycosylase n=1 Tax=Marinomonas ostreistagni TaxID=359209 RepID=UPI001951CD47|nr:A/G-specific adenine glycosylase [Marinomonas ostreistagni]MBM6552234.1 A/G-specific adenine glycosylase [Marinomonas ostreistagni]
MIPKNNFAPRVLDWFDQHGRKHLPWQQNKTPYRVWISEIMLQQTQVTTVIPYYERFMSSFPDVYALASAPQDDVLAHWSGLGYYARARNMHKAAQKLVDDWDGEFPATQEGVCELPGIGRSTAAAILSISRNEPLAILDGNVKRVLARFHAIPVWPGERKTEAAMWELAEAYGPKERCGDYTQAMMDLGATLCTRSKPRCDECPLQSDCEAYATGTPTNFPKSKPKKPAKPVRTTQMLVLRHDDQVLLEKRPATGIWGGLWSLPEVDVSEDAVQMAEQRLAVSVAAVTSLSPFRHTFSHYHLDIVPAELTVTPTVEVQESGKYQWFSLATALTLGLPAPVRTLLETHPHMRQLI